MKPEYLTLGALTLSLLLHVFTYFYHQRALRLQRETIDEITDKPAKKPAESAIASELYKAADVLYEHRRDIAAILYEVLMRDPLVGSVEAGSFEGLDKGGKDYHLTRVDVVTEALQLLATKGVVDAAAKLGIKVPELTIADTMPHEDLTSEIQKLAKEAEEEAAKKRAEAPTPAPDGVTPPVTVTPKA